MSLIALTRRARLRRRTALATALSLVCLGLAACTDPPEPAVRPVGCVQPEQPLSLAVGARANSPTPVLSPDIESLVRGAAKAGKPVSIVQVDGRVDVDLDGRVFSTRGQNPNKRAKDLEAWIAGLHRRVGQMRAAEPEADVLKALDVAAAQVSQGGTVVLMDSGLQTTPPLDFRTAGLLDAAPGEVVGFLRANKALPDLTGRSVLFVGVGDTAAPQAELDVARRRQLIAMWTAIANAAGATCVETREMPAGPTAAPRTPPVSLVPVSPLPTFTPCGKTVLGDQGSVGFIPDSDRFRDPEAARRTLAGLAELLKRPGVRVELIGTTSSWGTERGRLALSRQRAGAVARVLVELGVPEGRITTRGVGNNWPELEEDRDKNGSLLPGPAARNRSVIVRISCG
ncbi:OmpA family protein [Micromonospora echinofusca]|uniref:OmpA family protein n=1 Tax=Micromonospora echinofusca TaxID=47858 RepID=UPI0033C68C78